MNLTEPTCLLGTIHNNQQYDMVYSITKLRSASSLSFFKKKNYLTIVTWISIWHTNDACKSMDSIAFNATCYMIKMGAETTVIRGCAMCYYATLKKKNSISFETQDTSYQEWCLTKWIKQKL